MAGWAGGHWARSSRMFGASAPSTPTERPNLRLKEREACSNKHAPADNKTPQEEATVVGGRRCGYTDVRG